ncbi:MAG: prolipoprotein diacylglyceryl transferase, partial [Eisenbergiella porci]
MKNELFSIGPFTVYGYGLMIGIGIIAAYLTAESRAKKLKLDPEK